MKIFNENNEVIGNIKNINNSYRASWLVPKGHFNEGNFLFIGEYKTKDLAIQKLHDFLNKRQIDIENNEVKYVKQLEEWEKKDRLFWIIFISIISIGILVILLLLCKL